MLCPASVCVAFIIIVFYDWHTHNSTLCVANFTHPAQLFRLHRKHICHKLTCVQSRRPYRVLLKQNVPDKAADMITDSKCETW